MTRRILISVVAALGLATQTACTTSATSDAGDLGFNFATIGGLAGAGGGAFGASQLQLEGRDKIAAIAGATVVGGLIGYGVGAQIDKIDIAYHNVAAQRALGMRRLRHTVDEAALQRHGNSSAMRLIGWPCARRVRMSER